jgi:hypothetical protein
LTHVLGTETTHLLIGSSSTASALPSFLTSVLPTIGTTLLALDISANFLSALPPALESCLCLEELNVSSNPLRALPLFITQLASLRVLIADSTGIATLPAPLRALDRLHTLSIRRNKMYSLPSWLCLLVSLQTLLVDGNPFHGPWKALMEPLLARSSSGSHYQPSTLISPLPPTASQDTDSIADMDVDDPQLHQSDSHVQEDEDTITPVRALALGRAATSPNPIGTASTALPNHGVQRTRTTPSRTYFDKSRDTPAGPSRVLSAHGGGDLKAPDSIHVNEKEVRRMKSAGELRQGPTSMISSSSPPISPGRLTRSHHASSSNLLADTDRLQRFATVGPKSVSRGQGGRSPFDHGLWDKRPGGETSPATSLARRPNTSDSSRINAPLARGESLYDAERPATRQRSGSRKKDEKTKEQPGRWGFLKKMSMGKLRPDAPALKPSTVYAKPGVVTLPNVAESTSAPSPMASLINVRLSSTGSLGMDIQGESPDISVSSSIIGHKDAGIHEIPPSPSPSLAPSPSLSVAPSSPNLSLHSPVTHITKRRSFLPIEGPPSLLPSPGPFSSATSLASAEGDEMLTPGPSPVPSGTAEQKQRREEERARETYTRALRSVMAYLRDMNDLSVTQHTLMSVYSASSPDITGSGPRSRRPTTVDGSRVTSDGTQSSPGSIAGSRSGSSDQLRPPESISQLHNLNLSQTTSIATSDSGGFANGEERKFKDDISRRMRVVKEIVEYVEIDRCAIINLIMSLSAPKGRMSKAYKNSSIFISSQQQLR